MEELERRIRLRGIETDEAIQAKLRIAGEAVEHSQAEGFYDKLIVNDDLATTFEQFEQYVFDKAVKDGLTVVADVNAEEQAVAKIEDTMTSEVADVPMTEDASAPAEVYEAATKN